MCVVYNTVPKRVLDIRHVINYYTRFNFEKSRVVIYCCIREWTRYESFFESEANTLLV